jgi:hypothetical protein
MLSLLAEQWRGQMNGAVVTGVLLIRHVSVTFLDRELEDDFVRYRG